MIWNARNGSLTRPTLAGLNVDDREIGLSDCRIVGLSATSDIRITAWMCPIARPPIDPTGRQEFDAFDPTGVRQMGGSSDSSLCSVPNHPDELTPLAVAVVMRVEPIRIKDWERRGIPGADCRPQALPARRKSGFDHSSGGLCGVAAAPKLGEDLIGDFWFFEGSPTNDESAIPNRAGLVPPPNTQWSEAIHVRSFVLLDDSLLNFTDRERRTTLVLTKEFEGALSVSLRA